MTTTQTSTVEFAQLGVRPNLLALLAKHQFVVPTPIQAKTIPIAIDGQDLIGIAQTGTGKTLAFGIPILQRLGTLRGQGLVIAPTRELAQQINEALLQLGRPLGLRTAVLIGGEAMPRQLSQLRAKPHIIIVTPGRLIDHLERRTVSLSGVTILVLDEADRMLDMGFAPQIKQILAHVPRERQTMLFSATIPETIARIAREHMRLPVRIEVAPSGTAAERVSHEVFFVDKKAKLRLLEKLLAEYHGTVLVFSRTKFGAKRIARAVNSFGHTAVEIHSNRTLAQRRSALDGFKRGAYRVLVATDIAARGIDVRGIELVLNFDLPATADDYVHRIGRTGRAGLTGRAISFATPDQRRDIRDIERLIRCSLPVSPLPELPSIRHEEAQNPERPPQLRGFRRQTPGQSGRPGGRGFRRPWRQKSPHRSGRY